MEKKTLMLMLALGLVIAFAYFFMNGKVQNGSSSFNLLEFLNPQNASGKASGRFKFSDLLITPTPSETPIPSETPFPTETPSPTP